MSVTFGLTKNLGNFNSARADVTVDVGEVGSADDAMLLASGLVKDALNLDLAPEEKAMLQGYRSGREADRG